MCDPPLTREQIDGIDRAELRSRIERFIRDKATYDQFAANFAMMLTDVPLILRVGSRGPVGLSLSPGVRRRQM